MMAHHFPRIMIACIAIILTCAQAYAVSVEEEVGVGREVMKEVRHLRLTADSSLECIAEKMSGVVARQELPWRFWVIEDWETYNAFAAPGGFVFITRTYYEKLSEDEAAFVLGHEMAHIDLHHYERNVKRHNEATIGHLLLNLLIKGGASSTWRTATDLSATAYLTHYSRALEKEADLAGYKFAEAAGYDARRAVTALSKLGEQPNVHPWIVNLYGTHPLLTSREDRLAAMGGEEPEEISIPEPAPEHRRNLTNGLDSFDPKIPIAVRILAPNATRWENPWRKDFTKHLHLRLTPLGFTIAGDDLMYKPHIGDPVDAAKSRNARYLLLVTVHAMSSETVGQSDLAGTPVKARIDTAAKLLDVDSRSVIWEGPANAEEECRDILPVDSEILYTDTCIGALAERIAGDIAISCARAVRDKDPVAVGSGYNAATESVDTPSPVS